jgi:hypothetical protein
MKTQNTEIQKHNNIVSVTTPKASSTPKVASPHQIEADSVDRDAERRRAFLRESIERKQRADSFYHSLKPEQQTQLLEWLQEDMSLVTIMNKVSAPPPKGFGVKVHLTSLRRLRAWWRGMDEVLRTEEILDTVHDMDRHCDLSEQPRIQEAISQMLHEKAFELARTHPGSEVLGEVLSSITKLAALDHKREKLLLDRQKLLRSFTTEAPKHHRVDLNIIPPARPVSQIDPSPAVQNDVLAPANALQISAEPKQIATPVPPAVSDNFVTTSPLAGRTANEPSSANRTLISPRIPSISGGSQRLQSENRAAICSRSALACASGEPSSRPAPETEAFLSPALPPTAEPVPEPSATSSPKTVANSPKIGRNDPCPCGSGHKFKKCCLSPKP